MERRYRRWRWRNGWSDMDMLGEGKEKGKKVNEEDVTEKVLRRHISGIRE